MLCSMKWKQVSFFEKKSKSKHLKIWPFVPPVHPQTWTATHYNAVQCELPGQHLGSQRGGLHTSAGHHGLRLSAWGDSARRHCHHRPVHRQVVFAALTWTVTLWSKMEHCRISWLVCVVAFAYLLWACCILSSCCQLSCSFISTSCDESFFFPLHVCELGRHRWGWHDWHMV